MSARSYEQRLIATPLDDWRPGDALERRPHLFVGLGPRCGVEIEPGVRCRRFGDHPIHRTGRGK